MNLINILTIARTGDLQTLSHYSNYMQYVPIEFWTHDLTLRSYMWEKELLLETWLIGIDFKPYIYIE